MRTITRIKYWRGKRKYKRRKIRKQQHGWFLNRCGFAYTGRDVVNQVMKGLGLLAPKLIGQTSKEIDINTEARLKQIRNQGGQQIHEIAPLLSSSENFRNSSRNEKGCITDKIYHGCGWRYVDLGGKLINFEIGEKCLLPTSTPFSEEPTDNRMHIRWLKKGRLIHGLIKNADEITNNWQF